MEDAKIIDLYFARSEDAICQTDAVYGNGCSLLRTEFSMTRRMLRNPSAIPT